jgi:hypothetical protein
MKESTKEIVKFFGISIGLQIGLVFVACLFLLPGLYLFARERGKKKRKEEYSKTTMNTGLALMVIGMIIGGGLGIGLVGTSFFEIFE